MKSNWQLQEAKNRLSEVIERACAEGPQHITRRGKEVVVVVSSEEYSRLSRPEEGIVDFFARSPFAGIELDMERDRTPFRGIDE